MKPHTFDSAALDPRPLSDVASEAGNNGSPHANSGQEREFEDLDYEPIPPRNVVMVSVRYCVRGRGQPLPYPLDERDGE